MIFMNWKTLIQELLDNGMTQVQIADEIGVKQPTISGILKSDGTGDMRWQNGERLRMLHLQRIGLKRAA